MSSIPEVKNESRVNRILKWTLLIVAVACFIALIWGTVQTYRGAPPLPNQFVTPQGQVIMTSNDITAGKASFQRADLMDYGSIYGMGSYFGEDYTAKYLVELGMMTENAIAESQFHKSYQSLSPGDQYVVRTAMQNELQHIDLTSTISILSPELMQSVQGLQKEIATSLLANNFAAGWTRAYSLNPASALQVADFLIYSSFTTIAHRPGLDYSYTNNWPYEPLVGNTPSNAAFLWTWASFCFVFFCIGIILWLYQRYLANVDDEPKETLLHTFKPLTASQKRLWKYFLIVALTLLAQIAAGTILAHYYSDRADFYGINPAAWLPFNFVRDVHIQTPIVWIGLAWISSALFIAPLISGREAKHQGFMVNFLFWVTLFVVVGAIIGDYLGIMGFINKGWFWFGNQGLSYIQLGRFWQLGFSVGLLLWSFLVFRALWPNFTEFKKVIGQFCSGKIRLEHLFWVSTLNVAVLYWFGMIPLTGIESSFTITDFWRWWVVHLWVEQSFEFFAACVTAYLLMGVGLVSRQLAERTVLLETILIFLGGVLGTGHHWYWIGAPSIWLALGTTFSFIEVLPLVLLVIEAMTQWNHIKQHAHFPYRLAYLYIIGAAWWNFIGAGVFGGATLNAPLINYYEHATFLTLNHAHTALFGAFGLLALGMVYFCLRYATGNAPWSDRLGVWAFWSYNLGLVLWIVLNFFPIGWMQLNAVYTHGFAYARSLDFYNTTLVWQWLRLPGDVIFAFGAVIMGYDFLRKIRPFFVKPI